MQTQRTASRRVSLPDYLPDYRSTTSTVDTERRSFYLRHQDCVIQTDP